MSEPEQEVELVVGSLAALLRSAADSSRSASQHASRAQLLLRADTEGNRTRRAKGWWLGAPALLLAAALLVWWATPSALGYEVIGAEKDGAYVSAPSDRAVSVRFSDDTLVAVAAGSQLRVEDTNRRGARVLLERGGVGVHVVHRERTRWTFAAGPFEVLVTGTRFDLNWDPTAEVLDLRLREGSVEIQTPFGAAPVALRAGQEFRAELKHRSMTTTDVAPAPRQPTEVAAPEAAGVPSLLPADAQAVSSPPVAVTSNLPAPSAAPNAAPSTGATRSWPKLLAAGEFNTLVTQATERGIGNCLRACGASDLSALADAARYTGRADLADQSLRALRARFAADPEGRSAAFLLGRLREGQGAASDARTWYQIYLNEAPGGHYAAEALAGKMRTTLTAQGRAAATPVAEEYLRLYPTGVQAVTARGILGDH